MYTATNKGFTVITNFGCDQNCKYCITKFHPILRGQITDEAGIDWAYLERCISEAKAPEINLSGGGDPFFEWQKHREFYFKMYELAVRYGKKLASHTRIIPDDPEILNLFSKLAVTIEYYDETAMKNLEIAIGFLPEGLSLRVIQVLNDRMSVLLQMRHWHRK